MPSIKCLACGHRNMHAAVNSICSNCGVSLAASALKSPAVCDDFASGPASQGAVTEMKTPGMPTNPPIIDSMPASQNIQSPVPPPSKPARWTKRRDGEQSQELVPQQRIVPAEQKPQEGREQSTAVTAYQNSYVANEVYPDPFKKPVSLSLSPYGADERSSPMIMQNQPSLPTIPPSMWTLEELPRGYRHTPALAGKLLHVQGQMEEHRTDNILGALGKLLADMIWPSSAVNDAQRREKDQIFVTTLRIRTENGIQKDARLHGHLTSANLTLGDTILLWGRNKGGALRVRRGYNYTSKSRITTRSMNSSLPFFMVCAFMLVVLFLYLYLNHFQLPILPHH